MQNIDTLNNTDYNVINGQVRSAVTDSDFYLFVIPMGQLWDSDMWHILVIPTTKLEDVSMPGYLTGRVPSSIIKEYMEKSPEEVLSAV